MRVSHEELLAFETEVQKALALRKEDSIEVLGYGEVSTVLGLRTAAGHFACKRLPPQRERAAAEAVADLVGEYVSRLESLGVRVIETDVHTLHAPDDTWVVYCVQPTVPEGSLGPDYFRTLDEAGAAAAFERVIDILEPAVTPEIAPDGQLSNWAFVGDEIFYVDISSPFLRDEHGNAKLDWYGQLAVFPQPARSIVYYWVLPRLLDKYHTLRGQIVDFLGNLTKEKLDRFTPALLTIANRRLEFDPPVSPAEITAYYVEDARTYAAVQAMRRMHRWWWRNVLRRPYPYFLAPKIDRNI